jgi:hypothetical protein
MSFKIRTASAVVKTYRWANFKVKNAVTKTVVPSAPHLDAASLEYFEATIPSISCYLEYGSGGSTFVAHKFVKCLVSVESDKGFARAVERTLEAAPSQAEVVVIPVNIGLTEGWGRPVFKTPTPRRVRRWRAYPKAPWEFFRGRDIHPDLVFIDGRFRVACALETLLNQSAESSCLILIDDYEGRPYYAVVEQFADLVEMQGRMGVFRRKGELDREACQRALESAYGDFR